MRPPSLRLTPNLAHLPPGSTHPSASRDGASGHRKTAFAALGRRHHADMFGARDAPAKAAADAQTAGDDLVDIEQAVVGRARYQACGDLHLMVLIRGGIRMQNIYTIAAYRDAIAQAEAHLMAAKNVVSALLAEQRSEGEHNPHEAMLEKWIEHAQ